MAKLLKWIFAMFMAITVLTASFAFYTRFLVDYSLESLETALAATEGPVEVSSAVDTVYKSLADDLAVEEISSENLDLKNLVMTEATARSFRDSIDRNGRNNAKMYLNQLAKRKKSNRSGVMNVVETLQVHWMRLLRFLNSFSQYFEKKIESRKGKKSAAFEAARFVMLNKAQKLEKDRQYTKLIALYRQYLSRYPDSPDYGFVTIALANMLIREGRTPEAEQLFRNIQRKYSGKIESSIASQGLKKIGRVNTKAKLIENLRYSVNTTKGEERRVWQLKLAKAYISVYQFSEAEKILTELVSAKEEKLRQNAEFYLGWIYKRENQLPAAEKIFKKLLSSQLSEDLELGVRAQLADIYNLEKKSKEALEQYNLLSRAARKGGNEDEVWTGFSSYEQANIYYWDLKDESQARMQLNESGGVFGDGIQASFFEAKDSDLRLRGFQAIRQNQIGLAYELLMRHATNNPRDAWTQAGLATVHLIMGELKEAQEYTDKAYQLQSDEYTASMVGYINSIQRNYKTAAQMYQTAIQKNPEYMPAKFNLACMKIRLGEYADALKILEEVDRSSSGFLPLVRAKVLNNIGFALYEMGQTKQALEKFEEAVKIEPDYTVAAKNLNVVQKAVQSKA
jgi:tetratricopeptide (TPR) repeat protein